MDIEEAKGILTELGLELKEREMMRDILKDNYPEFLEEYIEFSSKADEAIKVVLEQLDYYEKEFSKIEWFNELVRGDDDGNKQG